jgi:uncharacterized protein (UPF0216 family)
MSQSSGIRVTIYVRDEIEFKVLKEAAKSEKRTVSNYLIRLHELHVEGLNGNDNTRNQ